MRRTGLLLGFGLLMAISTRPAFAELVAHWNFNEGQGALVQDVVGGVTGTIIGCHTWVASDGANDGANTCLELQKGGGGNPGAIEGYVDVGNAPQFAFGNAPFSVAAWVRLCPRECAPSGSTAAAFPVSRCHSWPGFGANGYILGVNEYALNGACEKGWLCITCHSDVPGSAAVVTDQNWHLLVGVGTASENKIYVDDQPPVSIPRPSMELFPQTKLILGGISRENAAGASGHYFGLLDDVRIWNHALTPAEISSLYLTTRPVNPPALACHPCGACCLSPQECEHITQAACDAAGGLYIGDNILCDPGACAILPVLDPAAVSQTYAIEPPAPNPFTFGTSTSITYEVPTSGAVDIAIYDVSGRMLRHLVQNTVPAGRHLVEWDGRDDNGRPAGSGVYFYSMRAGSFQSQRRIVVLR